MNGVFVEVWSLTTDSPDGGITTTLHCSEDEAIDTLFENFDPEGEFPRDDVQPICDMGVVVYIDSHLVPLSGLGMTTGDMWLVYADEAGDWHYQHWRDVEDVGTLINPESGDDMELIGWTTTPPEEW